MECFAARGKSSVATLARVVLGRVVWAQPVRAQRVCSYLVAAHSALFFWIWHARGGGHAGVGERGRARSTRGQVRLGLMAVWMGSAGTGRCAAGF